MLRLGPPKSWADGVLPMPADGVERIRRNAGVVGRSGTGQPAGWAGIDWWAGVLIAVILGDVQQSAFAVDLQPGRGVVGGSTDATVGSGDGGRFGRDGFPDGVGEFLQELPRRSRATSRSLRLMLAAAVLGNTATHSKLPCGTPGSQQGRGGRSGW